jgi:hypothetical protein
VLAERSSHWIMQDQPDLVLAAIHEVAHAVPQPEAAAARANFSAR